MDHSEERGSFPLTGEPTTRRELLRRAGALGIGATALTSLLAACGGTSNAPATSATGNTTAQANPTAPPVPTAQVAASPAAGASPAAQAAGTPKKGGTLVLLGHQEVASLSPDDTGPTVQWTVITQIHNAMLELDENFILQPVLAESVETSQDGLTYTFKLRKGVKFHDGSDFSSNDVKYTFDYYRDPKNAMITANNFRGIASVDASDPNTVVIKMTGPNAPFLALGATSFIVPAKYHAQVGEKTYKTKPVGTGAFKISEWIPADHSTVVAFDQHFRGRPNLDAVRLNVVPEASVRTISLQTGKADSAVWPLLAEDNVKLSKDPNFVTYKTSSVAVNHFPLNNTKPALAEKEVRQAMMYAIDRQKVIKDIFAGTAVIATSNLSPALQFYYEPNVTKYDYNPDKAKQVLDAAGWKAGADGIREKNGQKLSFTCNVITGDQARKPEAEVVQQSLKAVGIDMKIQEQPVAAINAGLREGKLDAGLYNWTYGGTNGDPDASDTLRSDGGSNFSHYKSDKVDQLLDQGRKEVDQNKRKDIYGQIQKQVAEDVPFIFMMYWDWYNIFTKRVKGLPKSALNGSQLYAKAYQWWIE